MTLAYLSLGSNLGDRESFLERALQLLDSRWLRLRRTSGLWETEPCEVENQPWFLNLVAEVDTNLAPAALLERTARVERRLGRRRRRPKGPRTIDIDILLYGDLVMDTAELTIPHPRMAQRRFVLEPLSELAPELRHPVLGRTVRELAGAVTGQRVRQYSRKRTRGAGS